MPDADKIGKFSRRWSKMYRKLCEGHFDDESLANDAMISLRKDIEDYGNFPIQFLKEASDRFERVRNNPLFLPVHDWSDEERFIRDLKFSYMQKYRPNQRGIDLAISAFKDLVHTLRNDGPIGGNLDEVIIRSYVRRIYDSNFTDLVPLMLESQMNADWAEINNRINGINVFVDEHIDALAPQIAKRGNVKRLKLPSRPALQKNISITDDVFSLGNNNR